jgi:hypothetical protein
MDQDQVKLAEALARLRAVREHGTTGHVDIEFVEEYHSVLTLLAAVSGVNLDSFRIPQEQLQESKSGGVLSILARTRTPITTRVYCKRAFFLMKIDGVIGMFKLLNQPRDKASIGFSPGGTN